MTDRLQVLPGEGTAIRYATVVAWAGPSASPTLVAFLAQSARNVGGASQGGRQVLDHVAAILTQRDPEPGAPFALLGLDERGWATLLHGPVQLWDGTRWLAPSPSPGWLRAGITLDPAVSIGPAGSPSSRLVADGPHDLVTGVVPGGGIVLLADPSGARHPPSPGLPAPGPAPLGRTTSPGHEPAPSVGPPHLGPRAGADRLGAGGSPPAHSAAPVDLRGVASRPPSPLAAVGAAPDPREPGRPGVTVLRCDSGHPNHPACRYCARCGTSLAGRAGELGGRPPLGVLIADDGTVARLDHDLVVGTDPSGDPGVGGGRALALRLGNGGRALAPSHAEVRLNGWSVEIVDRGSAGGTFVVAAGQTGWVRLKPFEVTPLTPGSHLALGQRVLTYVGPWPAGGAGRSGPDGPGGPGGPGGP